MAQDRKRKATLTAILLMAVLIGLFTLAGCGSSKEDETGQSETADTEGITTTAIAATTETAADVQASGDQTTEAPTSDDNEITENQTEPDTETTMETTAAEEVVYGTDPYGFAMESSTWWDTVSYRCNMDIKYATSTSSGESWYEIVIEWADSGSSDNVWEIGHGTYDPDSNAIVFNDCCYYTLTWDENDTETRTDFYTNGSGSIVMDDNHRLYWKDDLLDKGASCVFENESYSY